MTQECISEYASFAAEIFVRGFFVDIAVRDDHNEEKAEQNPVNRAGQLPDVILIRSHTPCQQREDAKEQTNIAFLITEWNCILRWSLFSTKIHI